MQTSDDEWLLDEEDENIIENAPVTRGLLKEAEDRDEFLKATAVLVPKNDTAARVNDELLDTLIDGQGHRFVSINGTADPEHQRDDAYPEEYLASIKESTFLPMSSR